MNEHLYTSTNLNKKQVAVFPRRSTNPHIRDISQLKAQALRCGFFRVYVALNNLHWTVLGRRSHK
jgi:hypothetical protein